MKENKSSTKIEFKDNLNGKDVEKTIESFFDWGTLADIKLYSHIGNINEILNKYADEHKYNRKDVRKAFAFSYLFMPFHYRRQGYSYRL